MTAGTATRSTRGTADFAGRLFDGLEGVVGAVVAALLAMLLLVVSVSVAARYFAGASILGADEAALWLHVTLVFLGLPLVASSALAMRLDLLSGLLGPASSRASDVLSDAVITHATLVLLFGGLAVMETIGGVSPVLGLAESWRFGPVVLGAGAALLLQMLRAAAGGRALSGLLGLALGTGLYLLSAHGAFEPLARPSILAGGFALLVLLLGAPLPHALVSGAALAIPFGGLLPEPAVVQNTVSGLQRFLLVAIPFFLLAGGLMTAGGLAERLVGLARSLVGHWRGGMAQTVLATNLMISGVSGSSIADAAFGAKLLAPELVTHGYRPERAAAIVAATSILPNIAPPSIAFLMLATATNLSVDALFVGGLAAGLVLAAAMAIALWATARGETAPRRAGPGERRRAFVASLPVLGLALVILLGLRLGIVTTTEAAAVAALYALAVCLLAGRGSLRAIPRVFMRAAVEASAVGLLIGTAAPFVFLLAVDELPTLVLDLFSGLEGPLTVLLLANLLLLLAGTFLDIGAGILLIAPLLMPVALAAGIDPIHFGVILVVNLMIGGLTPPVGVLVFVAARLSGVSPSHVFVSVLPLMSVQIAALGAITLYAAFAAGR